MKFVMHVAVIVTAIGLCSGCASTGVKTTNLKLGMAPDEVTKAIGQPTTIRASKVYEDGRTTQVWEYTPMFSFSPRTYWIFFENGKVVQWGEPGDFAGKSGNAVPVDEYSPLKKSQ